MTTTHPIWTPPIKLPDGHRLFKLDVQLQGDGFEAKVKEYDLWRIPASRIVNWRGVWALADDSGTFPADTDDGILWLDFHRQLGAGAPRTLDHDAITPTIPLLDPQGCVSNTITDTCTLLWLSLRFEWPIYSMGKTMLVSQAD